MKILFAVLNESASNPVQQVLELVGEEWEARTEDAYFEVGEDVFQHSSDQPGMVLWDDEVEYAFEVVGVVGQPPSAAVARQVLTDYTQYYESEPSGLVFVVHTGYDEPR